MKTYFRHLLEHYPHAAAESYHSFGWRGAYLATCAFVLRYRPAAITLPGFGRIDSCAEAINLIDNFSLGELRCEEVENHLQRIADANVVDVGVNIGVTSRWWLSLGPQVRVTGIDMFQEALDFTTRRIADVAALDRWRPICSGVGEVEWLASVRFADPLEGTSSLNNSTGKQSREIRVDTLDSLLASDSRTQIALLKLDIEGSAGNALRGARATLSRTDYVVIETHSPGETKDAARVLTGAGFDLFRCFGRTMWWRRAGLGDEQSDESRPGEFSNAS